MGLVNPAHPLPADPWESRVPVEFAGMLGVSLPMLEIFRRIGEAAGTDIPVLITGETGTGKDLVAAAIHGQSQRAGGPYVAVNTGAIATELIASELFGHDRGAYTGAVELKRGHFEEAHRGTIFLDEIGTMSESAQVALLRVLETKTFRRVGGEKDIHVDVRVVAASNEDPEKLVKERRFRKDLFYRLDVFRIHLPPLRERPGGVTVLTKYFVAEFCAMYKKDISSVAPETWRFLRRYSWPGNVRELKNVIQRAVVIAGGKDLTPDLLPSRIREAVGESAEGADSLKLTPGMTLESVEKRLIQLTLNATNGNKKAAAAMLGISRRALYDKLAKYAVHN
ncbi:MAG TPA: sigma-54 dependent transcriptional regulator [Candidatus Binatia bacterium]|jgi:transcriptional regulator with PAS, ATPase and Fis domain